MSRCAVTNSGRRPRTATYESDTNDATATSTDLRMNSPPDPFRCARLML